MGVKSPRKATGLRAPEWWKHLRPWGKRKFWKQTRRQKAENDE